MQEWEFLKLHVHYAPLGSGRDWQISSTVTAFSFDTEVLTRAELSELFAHLNQVGERGWELVNTHVDDHGYQETYYFKRPR